MLQNTYRKEKDFSVYNSMKTEELSEILRLDGTASTDMALEINELLYITGELVKRTTHINLTGRTAQSAFEFFVENYLSAQERQCFCEQKTV